MGKIFCITNQKGGVGKTTTAVNLGAGLSHRGKKILLVDLDPQGSLTSALGLKKRNFEFTVYDWLKGNTAFHQVAISHNGLHIVPASISLSGADIELSAIPGRELLLREGLQKVCQQFDGILIDCPPSLGLLTLNALTAADGIIVPIQAEYLALEGVRFLLETIEIVKKRLNRDLEIAGVIITMYDSRQILQREVMETIRGHFNNKVFNTLIRKNVVLAEAPGFGQDVFAYKPDSPGANDYGQLCREMIEGGVV